MHTGVLARQIYVIARDVVILEKHVVAIFGFKKFLYKLAAIIINNLSTECHRIPCTWLHITHQISDEKSYQTDNLVMMHFESQEKLKATSLP